MVFEDRISREAEDHREAEDRTPTQIPYLDIWLNSQHNQLNTRGATKQKINDRRTPSTLESASSPTHGLTALNGGATEIIFSDARTPPDVYRKALEVLTRRGPRRTEVLEGNRLVV